MKKLLLLAAVAGGVGGWWTLVGGRQLTEAQVRQFYEDQLTATLKREPETLCAQLDKRYELVSVTLVGGRELSETLGRDAACEHTRAMYQSFETLGAKMGGILQLDVEQTVHTVSVAADRKSATVDVSYTMAVGGSLMHIRSRATEVVIRRNGTLLLERSEARSSLNGRGA